MYSVSPIDTGHAPLSISDDLRICQRSAPTTGLGKRGSRPRRDKDGDDLTARSPVIVRSHLRSLHL